MLSDALYFLGCLDLIDEAWRWITGVHAIAFLAMGVAMVIGLASLFKCPVSGTSQG